MLSGRRRRMVTTFTCFAASTKKLQADSSNHVEIFFCHSLFSLHFFLGPPKKASKSKAEARGAGRVRNQSPENREIKGSEKSKREEARTTRTVLPLFFIAAFLKFNAGIFKKKFGFSSVGKEGSAILSKAQPEEGRAKKAFKSQTAGLFEKKERAKEKERKRAEAKTSKGGKQSLFLTSLFPGKEEKSKTMETQRHQKEGR